MRAIIDTNVILDVFTKREPHVSTSAEVLKQCGVLLTGSLLVSQTTDIYYLLRRAGMNHKDCLAIIDKLAAHLTLLDTTEKDVRCALESPLADYEDALIACRAARWKADYIITRNVNDFAHSVVPAIGPEELLLQEGFNVI